MPCLTLPPSSSHRQPHALNPPLSVRPLRYLNLKGADHLDYASYLQRCSELQSIDKSIAGTAQYYRYVTALHAYWVNFLKRTQARPAAPPHARRTAHIESRRRCHCLRKRRRLSLPLAPLVSRNLAAAHAANRATGQGRSRL